MKILIVSDTHKSHKNLETVLEREGHIDMLIHLGDAEGKEDYINALVNCPFHVISGNNDFFSDLPREEEFFIGGSHVFITHGHYYYVGMSEERLKAEARGRGADIVMYGHTHRPALTVEDDLVTLNPGSVVYPRQEGRKGSYIVMRMDDKGNADFEIKFV
ncbi:phosphodiesterase family protein [[Clostridium] hylemonae DSM 15053]|uniref:Phosphoesterase n=1 Tax=[Clostridium] hylemonae DSM 15053 TaxID=553973 RepID=C0C6Y6_9FIRM|nr:metallophosphoesterase [[Clostridium] hylemonae]EEG72062.1 phosphodiesterase family protein [[Clostridium] hylemonae DSM 15053]